MAKNRRRAWKKRTKQIRCRVIPIDVLVIFDLYITDQLPVAQNHEKSKIEVWQSLVHVCRRWRGVVFGSPRRLNLRLVCTKTTPARATLDVWPALPLLILDTAFSTEGLDNINPALEHRDRVYQIGLSIPASQWEKVMAAMQVPFPELTSLRLTSYETVKVLPDLFLGGSAPRLRSLSLYGIPFPGLPKLLLSATHLVDLNLWNIPHSGYISPEAMATVLSTLTNLGKPTTASPDTLCPPHSHLTEFQRVSEYLDDLVARIDAPRLDTLVIFFFNNIVFDTPHLIRFVNPTPSSKALKKARVVFDDAAARVTFTSQTPGDGILRVEISCREPDWQLLSLEQVFTSCLPPISTLEDLYVFEFRSSQLDWQDNTENTRWLELLRPFITVRILYLSKEFVPPIVAALQELIEGRTAEVLPTLENVFLEDLEPSEPAKKAIQQFVAARQAINKPIAISRWENSEQDKARW